jgi:Concanavalin A-like lectin/glucanases superfamily
MSYFFGPNLDQLIYCPAVHIGPAFTLAGWFYPVTLGEASGQGGQGMMIWQENTGTDARGRTHLASSPAGQLQTFSDFTGTDAEGITNTAAIALNNWHWLGMTWNISTPSLRPTFCARLGDNFTTWEGANVVYTIPTGSPFGTDGGNVRIGNDTRYTRCFHGYIGEAYVWNRMLTAAEMREVAFKAPDGAGLTGNMVFWYYWEVPNATDHTGQGRTAGFIGNPTHTAFEPPRKTAPPAPVPTPLRVPGKFGPQTVT